MPVVKIKLLSYIIEISAGFNRRTQTYYFRKMLYGRGCNARPQAKTRSGRAIAFELQKFFGGINYEDRKS